MAAPRAVPAPVVSFRWAADPGCPGAAWASRSLASLLARPVVETADRAIVDVAVHRGRHGAFEARILLAEPSGEAERRVSGGTCESVSRAATLVVAIALAPVTVADRVRTTSADDLERRGDAAFGIDVAAVGDVGSLPAATLGGSVGVELSRGPFRALLRGSGFLPRLALRGPRVGTGGEIGLFTAELSGCFDPIAIEHPALGFGACVGAEAGVMRGRGVDLAYPETTAGFWSAARAGIVVRAKDGALRPWLSVDAGVAIARPVFDIDDFGKVFRAAPVSARATLGAAWIFP